MDDRTYLPLSKTSPKTLLASEWALTRWGGTVKKYYEELGYVWTGLGSEFVVRVNHLTPNSMCQVSVFCPNCNNLREMGIREILKYGHTLCAGCAETHDISNVRFGKLTVKKWHSASNGKEGAYWVCRCDCGNHTIAASTRLTAGRVCSCGCHLNKRYNFPSDNKVSRSRQRQWREEVLKRDGHSCRICSEANNLVAHHLFSLNEYPQFRWGIWNGITLCYSHHSKFHFTFMGGTKNPCTYTNFIEFLEWIEDERSY